MRVHQNETAVEQAEQRHMTYLFLSTMYIKEVSRELLEAMRDRRPDTGGLLDDFFAGLKEADLEEIRIDLAADYAQLFLGMSENPIAPYESVYTSSSGLLMQKARDQVLALYRQEGLAVPDDFGLPEDHLSLEFDFMASLSRSEAEALAGGKDEIASEYRKKQKQFLQDHLINWVPRLCDDTQKRAQTDFYRSLARLTKMFLENDAESMKGFET